MDYLKNISVLIILSLGAIVLPCIAEASNVDVRILIDVSGSMKTNDPKNLRIPAVRLIAELMPQGATAGIWAFSEKVDQLLAASLVDEKWKATAKKATKRIHSRGLFTDIEAALKASTHDWHTLNGSSPERHVILLTDGMVDISKQATANATSRKRILENELIRIKASGARIHTIALSQNSDHELMTALAEHTEGWAEQVDDAAALQRVFLHIFEQAASPDSIPLLNNRFEVDGSISELTLLVFHGPAAKPLQLVNPAGKTLQQNSHPTSINWRAESGYDLITIGGPTNGTWQINTDPDPDNRVLIVTDLKLELDSLPTNLLVGESIILNAHITERGQSLQREDFLSLLQAELVVSGLNIDAPSTSSISFDPLQSRFTEERIIDWPPGEYEFVVRIDGGTFKREKRSRVRIHDAPITFSSSLTMDGMASEFLAQADNNLVALQSLTGSLVVTKPDNTNEVLDLPSFSSGSVALTIAMPMNGIYQINPHIAGHSTNGRTLNFKATPLLVEITAGSDIAGSETGIDWLHSSMIILIGNIAIGLLLGVVWFCLGRRRTIPSDEVALK